MGNHDQRRIADTKGPEYVDALNMMLLTLPGTPTTYYGEELGMRGGNYTGLTPQDPYAITSNDPVCCNYWQYILTCFFYSRVRSTAFMVEIYDKFKIIHKI